MNVQAVNPHPSFTGSLIASDCQSTYSIRGEVVLCHIGVRYLWHTSLAMPQQLPFLNRKKT